MNWKKNIGWVLLFVGIVVTLSVSIHLTTHKHTDGTDGTEHTHNNCHKNSSLAALIASIIAAVTFLIALILKWKWGKKSVGSAFRITPNTPPKTGSWVQTVRRKLNSPF